ncbi:hypothetical protein LLEC1_05243 [Akanthomyces lecanii]|uniref:Uncharacterized protein n=1 Tax=Cordyceps confragosa TaxID=2714763 RepID=A0A179IBT1_CORDF|nr:hypothetical protein LLEC1_05243 [Akanthomyces lecanii]
MGGRRRVCPAVRGGRSARPRTAHAERSSCAYGPCTRLIRRESIFPRCGTRRSCCESAQDVAVHAAAAAVWTTGELEQDFPFMTTAFHEAPFSPQTLFAQLCLCIGRRYGGRPSTTPWSSRAWPLSAPFDAADIVAWYALSTVLSKALVYFECAELQGIASARLPMAQQMNDNARP